MIFLLEKKLQRKTNKTIWNFSFPSNTEHRNYLFWDSELEPDGIHPDGSRLAGKSRFDAISFYDFSFFWFFFNKNRAQHIFSFWRPSSLPWYRLLPQRRWLLANRCLRHWQGLARPCKACSAWKISTMASEISAIVFYFIVSVWMSGRGGRL